jgi:hypothetical protein
MFHMFVCSPNRHAQKSTIVCIYLAPQSGDQWVDGIECGMSQIYIALAVAKKRNVGWLCAINATGNCSTSHVYSQLWIASPLYMCCVFADRFIVEKWCRRGRNRGFFIAAWFVSRRIEAVGVYSCDDDLILWFFLTIGQEIWQLNFFKSLTNNLSRLLLLLGSTR